MSLIEWTEKTWNPVTGCSKKSHACDNCYAEIMAKRLRSMGIAQYQNVIDDNGWTGHIEFVEHKLEEPYHWRKPRIVFVDSMSDLFHEKMTLENLQKIFKVMNENRQHVFQLLTKRPENAVKYTDDLWWTNNIWMGTTVEDQEAADKRIPLLRQIPAGTRFISCEPLLGQIDLNRTFDCNPDPDFVSMTSYINFIDWIIVGGETTPKARPMDVKWARGLRDICIKSSTPFFFKSWGRWVSITQASDPIFGFGGFSEKTFYRTKDKKISKLLDGEVWNEMP